MSEFFVAGSWRNRAAVLTVVEALESIGVSSYSFVRTEYDEDAAALAAPGGADNAALDSTEVRKLFEQDLAALRAAEHFVLVLPAGAAAHTEAGIAFGLGKRCWAVGPVDRSETLYRFFEAMPAHAVGLVKHIAALSAVR
ncbi:hypothetical protein [Curtobacterium sp. MCBA15_012]|uniref:hypothetical protein n=1 Tax=Curtobacterium sp. MCBA15_012 TaxID=1898738 RepID=UPI0011141E05|nr:hypothetical protein [Curtobacterium sp. MCBA15_012]WIB00312.1 hypothetical protein QOL15_01085 [Curtobacterium sp. MCBA15_012]